MTCERFVISKNNSNNNKTSSRPYMTITAIITLSQRNCAALIFIIETIMCLLPLIFFRHFLEEFVEKKIGVSSTSSHKPLLIIILRVVNGDQKNKKRKKCIQDFLIRND
uniref:Uncharacterized protein n=1 Tax=Glossina brevipalpis TaxID=37001 RepID=A0A1A9WXX0_9MUSC